MQTHQRSKPAGKHGKAQKLLTMTAGLCLAASLIASTANASTSDMASETTKGPDATTELAETPLSVWSFCERATVATEMAQRLPRALLFSVAMVESGRMNPSTRKTRPWPWTINAEGQSYYFKTKSEAVSAARRLLKQGVRSFDVGCMQINMRYHPDAFVDLNAAFDPITNVGYSAEFLKSLHEKTDSWPDAIAAYHSQSKTRSQPYFARVIDVWTDQHARISQLAHVLREQAKLQVAAQLRLTQEEPIHLASMTTATRMDAVEAPVETAVAMERPAPKVLDGADVAHVREAAGAGVGLRLSIADGDFADVTTKSTLPPPHVMADPSIASVAKSRDMQGSAATILADATPTL